MRALGTIMATFTREGRESKLYYIRLKTEYGIFYKIGFTTLLTVEKRLDFSGVNDARYIDKVIFLLPMEGALKLEQDLHRCFSHKRAFEKYSKLPDFLLAGNGQTELYTEDVLDLDDEYNQEQRVDTAKKFKNQKRVLAGISEESARRKEGVEHVAELILRPLLYIIITPLAVTLSILSGLFGERTVKDELSELANRIKGEEKKLALDKQQKIEQEIKFRVRQELRSRTNFFESLTDKQIAANEYARKLQEKLPPPLVSIHTKEEFIQQEIDDLTRKKLIALLKGVPAKSAVEFLSCRHAFDAELIDRYLDYWNWEGLSVNSNLPWTRELIERFGDKLCWASPFDREGLASNCALPWTTEFIKYFGRECGLHSLSGRTFLPWSYKLIDDFQDQWDFQKLSENASIPWSPELIHHFKDLWSWTELSKNTSLPWSIELIDCYKELWDWELLSDNDALPWTIELVVRFEQFWPWGKLSGDALVAAGLCRNSNTKWTIELIERYKNHWNWELLSKNQAIPWSIQLVTKYKDQWDYWLLGWNKSVPMSLGMIYSFSNTSGLISLSFREDLRWSLDMIKSRENNLEWYWLSNNKALPWSSELVASYEGRWIWYRLSGNTALPWSIELIERYKARWNWRALAQNNGLAMPLLCSADVIEVMNHHLAEIQSEIDKELASN